MSRKFFLFLFLATITFLFINMDAEAQCAMCKQAVKSNLESNEGSRKIGMGLNTGILYLMGIPYLIFATIAFAFFRKQIMAKAQALLLRFK